MNKDDLQYFIVLHVSLVLSYTVYYRVIQLADLAFKPFVEMSSIQTTRSSSQTEPTISVNMDDAFNGHPLTAVHKQPDIAMAEEHERPTSNAFEAYSCLAERVARLDGPNYDREVKKSNAESGKAPITEAAMPATIIPELTPTLVVTQEPILRKSSLPLEDYVRL